MTSAPFVHITISARRGLAPLTERVPQIWIWRHLRRHFPNALAVVLMPDHIHIVVHGFGPRLPPAVRRTLGHFQRRFFLGSQVWQLEIHVSPISTLKILRRALRYVWLNPCAAGFVTNPLLWEFSTWRDLLGVVATPWTQRHRLAAVSGRSPDSMVKQISKMLSQDSRCSLPAAQLAPLPAPPFRPTANQLIHAVALATRSTTAEACSRRSDRRAIVQLSRESDDRFPPGFAVRLGCCSRTLYRLAAAPTSPILPAARICLADPRLTQELAANEKPPASVRAAA